MPTNDRIEGIGRKAAKVVASGVAVVLLAFAAAAVRQSPADAAPAATSQQVTIHNGNELVVIVRRLIAAGQYDAARQVIAAWHPNDATYRYRVQYVDGLIEKAKSNYPGAIKIFRQILADKPSFTFVRLDLTQTLYLAKDDDAAKYQAQMLIASGIDDKIGGGLKGIVGEIDARRPIQFRAFASILPSSNINSGTDQHVVYVGGLPFVIDDGSRRKSGIGVLVGGDVLLRHELDETYALVGSASVIGRMYPSIDRTDLVVNLSAGIERKIERGVVTLSAIGEQDYEDMDAAFRAYGGRLEVSRYVGEKGRVYGSLSLTERDFLDSTYRDGWRAEFSGFYDHFISANRFARVLVGAVHEDTKVDSFSFDEVSGGLGFYNEFSHGLTVYAQGLYARRVYDAPMAVFGIRKDDRFEVQATLTKRDFTMMGLAPQLTYSFVRNVSTSPFDDYTSHGLDVRLVKEF